MHILEGPRVAPFQTVVITALRSKRETPNFGICTHLATVHIKSRTFVPDHEFHRGAICVQMRRSMYGQPLLLASIAALALLWGEIRTRKWLFRVLGEVRLWKMKPIFFSAAHAHLNGTASMLMPLMGREELSVTLRLYEWLGWLATPRVHILDQLERCLRQTLYNSETHDQQYVRRAAIKRILACRACYLANHGYLVGRAGQRSGCCSSRV